METKRGKGGEKIVCDGSLTHIRTVTPIDSVKPFVGFRCDSATARVRLA